MRHRALIVLLIATIMLGTAPEALACWAPKASERKLATLTNRARINHDRRRLKVSDALSKAARVHSRRMARRGYLFHNTLAGFESLLGGSWNRIGENVGSGSRVRQIHRAFMDSPAHRDNILATGWRKLGTGTVRRDGVLWVTVLFTDAGPVRSKVGARSC
jgi:uncharacterized protein YkwD